MFLDLTDWDINNWVCRPDTNANNKDRNWYWPVEREDPDRPIVAHDIGLQYAFMVMKGNAMRTLGSSDEEIEGAFQRWLHPHGPGSGYQGPEG